MNQWERLISIVSTNRSAPFQVGVLVASYYLLPTCLPSGRILTGKNEYTEKQPLVTTYYNLESTPSILFTWRVLHRRIRPVPVREGTPSIWLTWCVLCHRIHTARAQDFTRQQSAERTSGSECGLAVLFLGILVYSQSGEASQGIFSQIWLYIRNEVQIFKHPSLFLTTQ
jgi:hypothetical protein